MYGQKIKKHLKRSINLSKIRILIYFAYKNFISTIKRTSIQKTIFYQNLSNTNTNIWNTISKPNQEESHGLATFSKYPITSTKPLHFENTTNFSIQTDIDINGKHIRIFNNHLESIRLQKENYNFIDSLEFKNDQERRKGIYDIFSKLKHAFANRSYQAQTIGRHIKNSPFPAIVCGDFNDTPISYVYRTVKGDLKDSFIESGGGFGGTYNGNLPSFRIDFIFHDKSFESFNHKRIKVNYSDHYPIKTTLKLPL